MVFEKFAFVGLKFLSKYNQHFKKINVVFKILVFSWEDHSIIHDNFVSDILWNVFKHFVNEVLAYFWYTEAHV